MSTHETLTKGAQQEAIDLVAAYIQELQQKITQLELENRLLREMWYKRKPKGFQPFEPQRYNYVNTR